MPTERLAIPASLFSVSFGLAGLTAVWHLAGLFLGVPRAVPTALAGLTVVVWAVVLALFVRRLMQRRSSLSAELNHPVTAPFLALIPITILVLVPTLATASRDVAVVVTFVGILCALPLGAWLTGRWLGYGVPEESLHSGYYLPTVAAGLISATALASLGYRDGAIMAIGLGGICWLLVGSVILNRNFVVRGLPKPLLPTMAIDVAPVVVAGSAWFAINDGVADTGQLMLAGFALLMVGVQIRLVSVYRTVPFSASFWAFSFSYCAVASYGMRWLGTGNQPWTATVSWVLVVAASLFIAALAARSIMALRAGTFLPREPARSQLTGPREDTPPDRGASA